MKTKLSHKFFIAWLVQINLTKCELNPAKLFIILWSRNSNIHVGDKFKTTPHNSWTLNVIFKTLFWELRWAFLSTFLVWYAGTYFPRHNINVGYVDMFKKKEKDKFMEILFTKWYLGQLTTTLNWWILIVVLCCLLLYYAISSFLCAQFGLNFHQFNEI